jgi:hypothetical protein
VHIADRRTALFAAIVLLVALVANFGYLAVDRAVQMDDSPTYIAPATNLAHGHGFRNAYGLFETRRTPGYPTFLVPFITLPNALFIAVVVQHAINAALAVGVFFLLLHSLGDAAAAFAGGLFFAVDIPSIVHANMIVTETLFTAITFVVLTILSRRTIGLGAVAAAGFLGGASVLVRPIALYVAVPLAIVIAAERRQGNVVRIVVFVVAFAALPLAWSARNSARGAGFTVSTITSWSLLFDRAAATQAMGDPGDYSANILRRRIEFAREVGDAPQATYSNHVNRAMDHFHVERYSPLALRIITRHPLLYFRAYTVALARTLFGGGARQLRELAGLSPLRAQIVVLIYTCTTTIVAFVGLVSLFRRDVRMARLTLAFVAYYLIACSMAEATSRFRVPVMPMIAVWFGCGLTAMIEAPIRWRWSQDAVV